MKGSFITRVLSNVGANPDTYQNTPRGKARRSRRSRAKRAIFFIPRAGVASKLKRTIIYERKSDGSVIPVLIGINRAPRYQPRFDAFGVARRIFYSRIRANLSLEANAIGMR